MQEVYDLDKDRQERHSEAKIEAAKENKKAMARIGFEDKPELIAEAEKMGITPAKLNAMKEYAALLRRTDKRMKQSAIKKKICEKFKVKLV